MSLNLMRIRKGISFHAGPTRTAGVKSGIVRTAWAWVRGAILEAGDEGAEGCSGEDDRPGGSFGEEEESEGREGEEDVCGGVEGGGGEGANECGEENADDAGVDAAKGGTEGGAGAEGAPERGGWRS